MCHVIPVKKRKENEFFDGIFPQVLRRGEIDSSEGFHRIVSIFGAAFDATWPPFLSALVFLGFKQCFGFA